MAEYFGMSQSAINHY
ncbi:hypothetical protein, partial [Gallibacterium anatis]